MHDLSSYNSFGLHVSAQNLIVVQSEAQLDEIDLEQVLILGKGSDVLFTDDYDGTVLIDEIKGVQIERDGPDYLVRAGGGVVLDELIAELVSRNISGMENLSAIPGTLGAAPVQNIGAYGVEIGDLIEEIEFYDLERHVLQTFDREQCAFAYRSSYFKEHKNDPLFISRVTLRLNSVFDPDLSYKGVRELDPKSPYELRTRIAQLRRQKLPDPQEVGNAGSFFKNPIVTEDKLKELHARYSDLPVYRTAQQGLYKLAAGWLIDKAGCRGITHGHAGTWEHQALVIVNRGGARPHEIVALAQYVRSEVANAFGILLEPEVRVYNRQGEISWEQL